MLHLSTLLVYHSELNNLKQFICTCQSFTHCSAYFAYPIYHSVHIIFIFTQSSIRFMHLSQVLRGTIKKTTTTTKFTVTYIDYVDLHPPPGTSHYQCDFTISLFGLHALLSTWRSHCGSSSYSP